MGFSLTAALGAATPLLQSVLPGGSTGTLSQIAGIAAAGFAGPPSSQVGPVAMAPRLPTLPRVTNGVTRAGSSLPTLFRAARTSIIGDILNEATENTGRRVTSRMIRNAARHCGIEVAADTFGLDVTQVCQVIAARRRRRSRGISAADMRRTRSTIRKVICIRKQLKAIK